MRHVVRAAGFGARPKCGGFPPTEGLPLHDGSGNTPIDVGIADFHVVNPPVDLVRVEGVQPAGEPVARGVLPFGGFLQGGGMHDAEDWPEALVGVVPRSGLDIVAQPRGPECPFLIQLPRFDQPFLPALELRQSTHELVGWGLDDPIHGGGNIGSRADFEGFDGVDQLVHESL